MHRYRITIDYRARDVTEESTQEEQVYDLLSRWDDIGRPWDGLVFDIVDPTVGVLLSFTVMARDLSEATTLQRVLLETSRLMEANVTVTGYDYSQHKFNWKRGTDDE